MVMLIISIVIHDTCTSCFDIDINEHAQDIQLACSFYVHVA